MKRGILIVVLLGSLVLALPAMSGAPELSNLTQLVPAAGIQDQPSKPIDVDVNIDKDGDRWAVSPVWLAIGAIGLVVLILLIAMAMRVRQ